MRVVIAGGHGKIALLLERQLADRGDTPVGLIRDPEQAADLRAAGAEPTLCDLESAPVDEVAAHLAAADAVIFAAGAGGRGGLERTRAVDLTGALKFADAAERAGIRRLLLVSSMGAGRNPVPGTDPQFEGYLRLKGKADADITARTGLDWTILRPGRLTDEPGTGRVNLAKRTGLGSVPREDVASVLAHLLHAPKTSGLVLELVSGDVPVDQAVQAAAAG
jgi:nucleoside-diphosphate-sugar epimerase